MKRFTLVLALVTGFVVSSMLTACSAQTTSAAGTTTTMTTTISTQATTTETNATPAKSEAQQLLEDMQKKIANASSYSFGMIMDVIINVFGGPDAARVDLSAQADGVIDLKDNALQMNMDMQMSSNAPDFPQDVQNTNINLAMYSLADWLYMKMNVPGIEEQWLKTRVDEQVAEDYDLNMIDEQFALLDSPSEINIVREEPTGGTPCYVVSIVPDSETLIQWIQEQDTTGTDLSELDDIMSSFREFSLQCWIAKDTKLLRKMTIDLKMEVTAEQIGEVDSGFNKMMMDIGMDMTIDDYDQPVNITLPPGAKNAIEIPGEGSGV